MARASGPPPLHRRTVLLDGGLSNQLLAQGCDLSGALWTGRVLAGAPGEVAAAHTAYLRAGAEVLITASYQVTDPALVRRSVDLAAGAAAAADRPVWVAGSVGPYGAVLADGSEYRGRYGLTEAELADFHRPRIEALAAAGADLLAVETVPDTDEARALLRVLADCPVPAWLSYTVEGGRTRAGQPLDEAFGLVAGVPGVVAVGVNCCDPREVGPAVRAAAAAAGKPVVAYPNDGSEWDAAAGVWRAPSRAVPWDAGQWQRDGARLIGGCCRVGPDRIAALATTLAGPEPGTE
ncbi:homocysteine S-methyltransferase [Streptomyces bambusae]|uniref:homocysteine S-methyltransferase n=1 Tax=Streptomyces bambusae TaxID=1550616 RepID=UPI001CFDE942|nr:homocysteine S-methyltransferase [Streptomyces bambusae]MCB5165498.1 homocysteine S-methyltransferase [Streptomyces bambusae]